MSLSLDPFTTSFEQHDPYGGRYGVPRVLYIDIDADLPGLLDRVEEAATPAILVLPEAARAIRGMVAVRLLQRRAEAAGITLVAVTTDRTSIAQLQGVGIATASTVGDARRLLPNDIAGAPELVVAGAVDEEDEEPPAGTRLAALPLTPPATPDMADDDLALDEGEPPIASAARGGATLPLDAAPVPVVSMRLARAQRNNAATASGHRRWWWMLGVLLLLALSGGGAWVFLFPQATIVISYAATSIDRTYRIVAGTGDSGVPVHTTHLDVSGTLTVPATGTTLVPYGHATGSITFANPLDGYVAVPVGTIVATNGGIAFATLAAAGVPRAEHSFTGTTNGQQSVQVEAVQPGPGGNVPAGAITRLHGRLAGVLLVTNYNPTGGGTLRTVYSITPRDTAGAVATLRASLSAQAQRTLRQRYARSPARAITGVSAGAPVVASVIANGRLFARVTLTVHVTMDYLHAQDVRRVAAAKATLNMAGRNLVVVPGSQRVTEHVAQEGDRFVIAVRLRAQVVPAIDTTNLRGLLAGRSVADARQLLDGSARYGDWQYSLQTNPDWAGRMPQTPSLIHITVRQIG